jgi:hypothetical protein
MRIDSVPSSAQVKACCAAGYSSDRGTLLLGDSYHPGAVALSRRLLNAVAVPNRDDRHLDHLTLIFQPLGR